MPYDAAMLVRHRLGFLIGVLAVALGLGAVGLARIPGVSTVVMLALGLVWAGLGLASIVALNASAPQTFQVRDGAFTTAPSATAILTSGSLTVMSIALTAQQVYEIERGWGVDPFQVVVVLLLILLTPLQWRSVLGPYGMRLRPDGLYERSPLGSLFVPWDAGVTAEPARYGLRLRLGRRDLLVRRGFRPGAGLSTGADRGFAAWAVNIYAARPDLRPSIGTPDGLRHLLPPAN
jgi:hypothetical protein